MRWRNVAFACATALLFAVTIALLLLPAIVERAIVARLQAFGLENVALEVADLSFHRIRLADVRIGEKFAVDRADVTFELRPPRMRTVRVSGARWEIGTTTTGLDLAPFDRLQRNPGAKTELPFERADIESARVSLPAYGAEVTLSGSLDPHGLTRLQVDGTAAEVQLGDRSLQQIALAATSTDGRSIQWNARTLSSGLSMAMQGDARITTDPPRAEVGAELHAEGDFTLASLRLEGVKAGARLEAIVDRHGFTASLLNGEATATSGTWQNARFTGVRAVIPSRSEIAMEPGESLRFRIPLRVTSKTLRQGDVNLGRGSASLRFESPRTVAIQRAEARLPEGGTLWTKPLRFELGARRIRTDLVIDHLSMKRWLALIGRGKVEGDGRMSGRVPVTVTFDPVRLQLGRGDLFTKPGAVLRVTDLKTAESWIDQAVLGSELAEVVKQRLLEALQELELYELEFRFRPRGDDVDLTVHLAGRGTRGARQEIGGLTINFRNFGTGLNQVLRAQEEMKHDPILDLFQ